MSRPAVRSSTHATVGSTSGRRCLQAIVTFALMFVAAPAATAGPWEATSAQGLTVRITQDPSRARDAYVLERRYPDGSLDANFGQQGATLFSLGPDLEGPAALRLDALGRPWIAGATAGAGDTLQAVLLRFSANGLPDASYGDGGRLVHAPAGRRARALDIAPMADGSCFVVGIVIDASGAERSGWWRVGPDGRVDTRFGLGGLWIDAGAGSTEIADFSAAADGSVALALRRLGGGGTSLESWIVAAGASAPAAGPVTAAERGARLVWQAGGWRWTTDGQSTGRSLEAPARSASASTPPAPQTEAAPQATPIAPAASASPRATEPTATSSWSFWGWLAFALATPAIWWFLTRAWRR